MSDGVTFRDAPPSNIGKPIFMDSFVGIAPQRSRRVVAGTETCLRGPHQEGFNLRMMQRRGTEGRLKL